MALTLVYDDDPTSICHALKLIYRDRLDYSWFRWAEGEDIEDKAIWIAQNAYFWHVWDRADGGLIGYIAAVPDAKNRWAVHFGCIQHPGHANIIRAWRKLLKIAVSMRINLISAYIPIDRPDIRRLAKIFKFRRFHKKLWVLAPLQKYSGSNTLQ